MEPLSTGALLGSSAISGGLSLLGSLTSGLFGYSSQQSANAANLKLARENNLFNAEQASLNRAWQEEMSNTAYQRTKADLIKAGFNPMLAISNGSASTPSGSVASSSGNPHMDAANPLSGLGSLGDAISSGLQFASMQKDMALKQQDIDSKVLDNAMKKLEIAWRTPESRNKELREELYSQALTGVYGLDASNGATDSPSAKAQSDMIQSIRNEIENARYLNSKERTALLDAFGVGVKTVNAVK